MPPVNFGKPATFTPVDGTVVFISSGEQVAQKIIGKEHIISVPASLIPGYPGTAGYFLDGLGIWRTLTAADIASGTFDIARIPDLTAAKITSGAFDPARLGSGSPAAGTYLAGGAGAPGWTPLPTASLTGYESTLGSDVNVTLADTWTDVTSITVIDGTYLVVSEASVSNAGNQAGIRVYDSTHSVIVGVGGTTSGGTQGSYTTAPRLYVCSGVTTLKLQAITSAATMVVRYQIYGVASNFYGPSTSIAALRYA